MMNLCCDVGVYSYEFLHGVGYLSIRSMSFIRSEFQLFVC